MARAGWFFSRLRSSRSILGLSGLSFRYRSSSACRRLYFLRLMESNLLPQRRALVREVGGLREQLLQLGRAAGDGDQLQDLNGSRVVALPPQRTSLLTRGDGGFAEFLVLLLDRGQRLFRPRRGLLELRLFQGGQFGEQRDRRLVVAFRQKLLGSLLPLWDVAGCGDGFLCRGSGARC